MDQPGAADAWHGPVDQLVYTLIFTPADHARAVEVAALIRSGRVLTAGAERYRAAVRTALAQPGPVGGRIPTDHGEAELRAFLQDLLDELA
jgi:hypothetical protein